MQRLEEVDAVHTSSRHLHRSVVSQDVVFRVPDRFGRSSVPHSKPAPSFAQTDAVATPLRGSTMNSGSIRGGDRSCRQARGVIL